MSVAIDNLVTAQNFAITIRPKVGGFPYLAEVLRLAGVTRNTWTLPSCQSVYITKLGPVVSQGTPLFTGNSDIPTFNQNVLVQALQIDQAGQSTFPEFLGAIWAAGVVRYDLDLENRSATYYGVMGEFYNEVYPAVEVQY